jgi:3-hydroxyacyl-CoA dehydrogenase
MARDCSESFRKNFLGIHLFNPPNVIVGTEVIPHAETDPRLVEEMTRLLEQRFGRQAILTDDKPAFAGNRIGFKVLNEIAILAGEHGVAYMDYVIGPYTGRAMPPLATVDLVGWDVHKAIIDNIYEHTKDEAHALFAMPDYMRSLFEKGHLGNKTPDKGGFFRRVKDGKQSTTLVLDVQSGQYEDSRDRPVTPVPFIEEMKSLNRVGRYRQAFEIFVHAKGPEGELARRVILGYVGYALNRVGETEVVRNPRDVDRIMGFGFNWAPPTVLVDLMGVPTTIRLLEGLGLPVPPVLAQAAQRPNERLFREPNVDRGRFFAG